jgi:hypothetical protein
MRWPVTADVSALWTREFHIDLRALLRPARERPEAVVLGIGIALCFLNYARNRPLWLDEGSLQGNVVDVPVLDFSTALTGDQLAPFGFLIVERAIATFLSSKNAFLRFPPLVAGIGALCLFYRLAPRILSRKSTLVALVLFAFSDDLIYYSSEFKPYSLDLAFGVAITLGAARALGRHLSTREAIWLALIAGAAPWFSFASAFVIAGCGTVLFLDAVLAGRRRTAFLWLMIGCLWLANFVVSYRASHGLLSPYTSMYRFWDFAFLPLSVPPTREGLLKTIGLLLEVFVNPLNLLSPGGTQLGVVLPMLLLIVGSVSLARRSPGPFLLLVAPIALAMAASVTRYYPFHGRLMLELVPALFLLIAEGTEAVSRFFPGRSGFAYKTLLVALLVYPSWDGTRRSWTNWDRDFNPHGDLHHNVFIDLPTSSAAESRGAH